MAALQREVLGGVVDDVARPRDRDDLLLVLRCADGKRLLHLAPGGPRARLTLTARRFGKGDFATGPQVDALRAALCGAVLRAIGQAGGERRCWLQFETAHGPVTLHCELFSARGLWCLCDGKGQVVELSRVVRTAVRNLSLGDAYVAPPTRAEAVAEAEAEAAPRFAEPVLAAIDGHFTALDQQEERQAERSLLQRALQRGVQRAEHKAEGLRLQIASAAEADHLRAEADLMLAYAHTVVRGSASMTVPDPLGGGELRIELDPALPVPLQAKARYQRARRLQEGALVAAERQAAAAAEALELATLAVALAALPNDGDLGDVRRELAQRGLLPKPQVAPTTQRGPRQPKAKAIGRQFVSAEGYPIVVGRSNEENDRITRMARGNDLWLHVGGGHAGSHVVVRLPKGRTASLESLLDAGTLAVHFSKARGARRCEVIYTEAKYVRKPKGLPPGKVVPHQVRSLVVTLDEVRLRRLLDSLPEPGP